jgi:hypothetical protein
MPAPLLMNFEKLPTHQPAAFDESRTDAPPILQSETPGYKQGQRHGHESDLKRETAQPGNIDDPENSRHRQGRNNAAADTAEQDRPPAGPPHHPDGSNRQPQQPPGQHETEPAEKQAGTKRDSRVNHG